ncbi:hypothetical protein [Polyangium spumosum]|uniref:Uncharacterized protein n=1 Tax=Polyangium spumosum TaxID=889282 RepID=A0A6N7PNA9_9BACT|nr:hypothetical protein [Polyangium spumosum]MRG93498.1 hypothetical protein [Polyangium spumosum]
MPEAARLVADACRVIWEATRSAATLSAAFAAAEAALRGLEPAGYTFEISGRLGITEDGEPDPAATSATASATIG